MKAWAPLLAAAAAALLGCSSGGLNGGNGTAGSTSENQGGTASGGTSGSVNGSGGATNPAGTNGHGGNTSSGGTQGSAGNPGNGGSNGNAGSNGAAGNLGNGGSNGSGGAGGSVASPDDIGPASFAAGDLDPISQGATITFQNIGAAGWYPSRRDPASNGCTAYQVDECCMAHYDVTGTALTPWDQDLVLTLRGPLLVKELVVYQPSNDATTWSAVSSWKESAAGSPANMKFDGDGAFNGVIGSECLKDAMTPTTFACGAGSVPYCPSDASEPYYGWAGSKLFVILASAPRVASNRVPASVNCGQGTAGNWYDAPWIGLSLGELVRAGKFSGCNCYSKSTDAPYAGDGCGQFNVFEVVNDNGDYQNFDLFSTNFFGYAGYVGEGPCDDCNVTGLPATADLVDKSNSQAATHAGLASPAGGPGVAFHRPVSGYRYFVVLLDVQTRSVQLALIHPESIPATLAPLLPNLPAHVQRGTIDDLLALRLPR